MIVLGRNGSGKTLRRMYEIQVQVESGMHGEHPGARLAERKRDRERERERDSERSASKVPTLLALGSATPLGRMRLHAYGEGSRCNERTSSSSLRTSVFPFQLPS